MPTERARAVSGLIDSDAESGTLRAADTAREAMGLAIGTDIMACDGDGSAVSVLSSGSPVSRSLASRLSNPVDAADHGALPSNPDNIAAMQSLLAAVGAAGGGTIQINTPGTYDFTVTGDSSTMIVPSNTRIIAVPGVTFRWGYFGSPLIACINSSDIEISGIKFVWTGMFNAAIGSGTRTFDNGTVTFGSGFANLTVHNFCCHVAVLGCDRVTIRDCRCEGATASNRLDAFINIIGHSDLSQGLDNKVRDCVISDVSQGVLGRGQRRLVLHNLKMPRYAQDSNTLYGPGHLVYMTFEEPGHDFCEITQCSDEGVRSDASGQFIDGGHTLSLKKFRDGTVRGLTSRRAEGAINFQAAPRLKLDGVDYYNDEASAAIGGPGGNGVIAATTPSGTLSAATRSDGVKMFGLSLTRLNYDTMLITSRDTQASVDWQISGACLARNFASSDSNSFVECWGQFWVGRGITLKDVSASLSLSKGAITFSGNTQRNVFSVMYLPSFSATLPRVVNNTANGSSPGPNQVNWEQSYYGDYRNYEAGLSSTYSSRSASQQVFRAGPTTAANPSTSFAVSRSGCYLLAVTVQTADNLNAMSATYLVTIDNAATAFSSAQQLGSNATKGASAPSAVAVTTSGLTITITGTAASASWAIDVGCTYLSGQR